MNKWRSTTIEKKFWLSVITSVSFNFLKNNIYHEEINQDDIFGNKFFCFLWIIKLIFSIFNHSIWLISLLFVILWPIYSFTHEKALLVLRHRKNYVHSWFSQWINTMCAPASEVLRARAQSDTHVYTVAHREKMQRLLLVYRSIWKPVILSFNVARVFNMQFLRIEIFKNLLQNGILSW